MVIILSWSMSFIFMYFEWFGARRIFVPQIKGIILNHCLIVAAVVYTIAIYLCSIFLFFYSLACCLSGPYLNSFYGSTTDGRCIYIVYSQTVEGTQSSSIYILVSIVVTSLVCSIKEHASNKTQRIKL